MMSCPLQSTLNQMSSLLCLKNPQPNQQLVVRHYGNYDLVNDKRFIPI